MDTIKKVKLGSQGLIVPMEGLGCMGMTGIVGNDMYGPVDENEAISTIHRGLELGMNFLDTADLYGPLLNERLVGKAIKGSRDKYIVATKFGWEIDDNDQITWQINGKPEYVKKAIDRSLKNLGVDYVDLYYLHRVDPNTPIEETVGAMAELVKSGKVRYIGLSEASAETVRKAHNVHPITALQSEYSLFEREIETLGIFETLKELGIGFVSYSPIGRGFLSGEIKSPDDFSPTDTRRALPRFIGDAFYKNLELVEEINKIALEKGVTSTQLALAWLFSKGVVPIPGTKRRKYLEENIKASEIVLTTSEIERLESIVPLGSVTGGRYDDSGMAMVNL